MKINLRWQLVLTAVCLAFVWVLLTFEEPAPPLSPTIAIEPTATYASDVQLCTSLVPGHGGELVEGVVGRPQFPNPLLADKNPVDRTVVDLVFDGLTRYNRDGDLEPHLAEGWVVSEDGLTVTFTLREGVVWHDGQPVTTADVAYTYGLLQMDATSSFFLPEIDLWRQVAIEVIDGRQIAFRLPTPYAPFLEATTRGILPNHLLAGVDLAGLASHPFNQKPVGTGPFIVQNNWQTDGVLVLLPHARGWADEVLLNAIQVRFYPSETALVAAFAAGEVTAVSDLSPTGIVEMLSLSGSELYTTVLPRYTQLLFNLGEENNTPIQEIDVRQALAQAIDKTALIAAGVQGQGLPFDGPYLPNSGVYDPNIPAPYTLNVVSATEQLAAAGWLVADGAPEGAVRQKEEVALTVRVLTRDTAEHTAVGEALLQMVRPLGMQVALQAVPTEIYQQQLANGGFDLALVDVSPAADPDLYDLWSQEAIVRGQNYGQWNSRRASEALEAARQVWSADERKAYYRAFLQFYQDDLPALTLYQHLSTYAVQETVEGVDIGRVAAPRDRYLTFAQWHTEKEELPVPCE